MDSLQQGQQPAQPQQAQNVQQPQQNAEAAAPTQPEDYSLDLPQGGSPDLAQYEAQTKALAKELGLSKEAAQKIVQRDLAMKEEGERRITEVVEQQRQAWAEQTKADTEVGGSNLERSIGDARTVLDKFATPAFKKEITESGYGNNVELIRLLSRIGKVMREDGFVQAREPARDSRKIADLMYPSMSANQ